MKRIGVVILSRFNSNRLPGKALIEINGKPVLQYIIERLKVVVSLENIVIATSIEDSDDPIAIFAKDNNIKCFRGDLQNVASRFYNAAITNNWDYAIRINGDNIFLDINLLNEMINFVNNHSYNFISNVKDRTYPKGMSIEIVNLDYYKNKLIEIENSAYHREHVMSYLYECPFKDDQYYFYNNELPEAKGIQLALDTLEDLQRSKLIIDQFNDNHWNYNINKILQIIKNAEKY